MVTQFRVNFNDEEVTLIFDGSEIASIQWSEIIRVCFLGKDFLESDEIYIFVKNRPQSYVIPADCEGGMEFWNEIVRRGLFDADLAIKAATAPPDTLLCWPQPEDEGA